MGQGDEAYETGSETEGEAEQGEEEGEAEEGDETEDAVEGEYGDEADDLMDRVTNKLVDNLADYGMLLDDDDDDEQFEDGSTVADYDDQDESMLQPVLGLRGGAKAMKAMKAMTAMKAKSHESHEGNEGNEKEQDCKGPHGKVHGFQRIQGEDCRRIDKDRLDEEQGWQNCEQEKVGKGQDNFCQVRQE